MSIFPYTESAYEAYQSVLKKRGVEVKDWDELPIYMKEAWSDAIQAAFDTHESHNGPFQE